MTAENTRKIVARAATDEDFRRDLFTDPDAVFGQYDLTDKEREALRSIPAETMDDFANQLETRISMSLINLGLTASATSAATYGAASNAAAQSAAAQHVAATSAAAQSAAAQHVADQHVAYQHVRAAPARRSYQRRGPECGRPARRSYRRRGPECSRTARRRLQRRRDPARCSYQRCRDQCAAQQSHTLPRPDAAATNAAATNAPTTPRTKCRRASAAASTPRLQQRLLSRRGRRCSERFADELLLARPADRCAWARWRAGLRERSLLSLGGTNHLEGRTGAPGRLSFVIIYHRVVVYFGAFPAIVGK